MSVTIVTGAARGIGKSIVERLALDARRSGEAAKFVLVDRLIEPLNELATLLNRDGFEAIAVAGELAEPDFCGSIAARAGERFGAIDSIVSNAGMYLQGPLTTLGVDAWDTVLDVNARAAWLLARAAHPFIKAARGQIVIVGSVSGLKPQPWLGAYCISKAAVMMLAQQMAIEWGPDGIRTNVVAPGFVRTPLVDHVYDDPTKRASREAMVPSGRIAEASEVASVVAFLLGRDSSYCNGATIVVDGGLNQSLMLQVARAART